VVLRSWSLALGLTLLPWAVCAQEAPASGDTPAPATEDTDRTAKEVMTFLGGSAAGLGVHESGHLLFGVIFGAKPSLKGVDFAGLPFFALTHRPDLSPRREYTVSAAGFWMQHATSSSRGALGCARSTRRLPKAGWRSTC
jgi:hypothetical protein